MYEQEKRHPCSAPRGHLNQALDTLSLLNAMLKEQ